MELTAQQQQLLHTALDLQRHRAVGTVGESFSDPNFLATLFLASEEDRRVMAREAVDFYRSHLVARQKGLNDMTDDIAMLDGLAAETNLLADIVQEVPR